MAKYAQDIADLEQELQTLGNQLLAQSPQAQYILGQLAIYRQLEAEQTPPTKEKGPNHGR
jgi:hypothetical protein